MYDRKKLKSDAKKTLKKHYILLIALCLIAVVLKSEFTSTTSAWSVNEEETASEVEGAQIIGSDTNIASTVYETLLEGNFSDAKKIADEKKASYENEVDTSDNRFGHTQGVMASLVNTVTSGTLWIKLVLAAMSITKSESFAVALVILLAALLTSLFNIFIVSFYRIVMRRMFFEARTYDKVPLSHFFHTFALKKNFKAALAYFRCNLYLFFWDLTIIGGIIKSFSYAMVPYILAENPDISGKDAITLSRKMMDGHKFELFKLYLSFLGWNVLSLFTLGILDIFFVNPYTTLTLCEYYVWLRNVSKENNIENIDLLNDRYLFEIADTSVLQPLYTDITSQQEYLSQHDIQLTGIKKFFVTNFGIWFGASTKKREYQDILNRKYRIARDQEALVQKAYPIRLNPLYTPKVQKKGLTVQFLRCYTIWSLILFFFLFSFIGWLWEGSLVLVQMGRFVNRGILLGPWIPIYGTGGCIALILLNRLKKNPPACFIGSMILSGILEYSTAWYMESTFHTKWWDYTGYFLNLDGRICAEGLLVFGVGCSLVIYLVGPLFDELVSRLPVKFVIPLAIVLLAVFTVDSIHASSHPNMGEGVTSSVIDESKYYAYQTDQMHLQL